MRYGAITREENEILTRTGPGTPAGELFRRYWQPAALSEELPAGGAPLPIRMLSEELVLFRNETGELGLLSRHCAHRGSDLSYGRLEDGGLRCIYHGWLYGVDGRCLEKPGEPVDSPFYQEVGLTAYPCRELSGLIFAYLGPGVPPVLPAYPPLRAPDEYRMTKKRFADCNYLTAHEGNMDPHHVFFLHRDNRRPGDDRRDPSEDYAAVLPEVEVEETEFGGQLYAVSRIGPETNRVSTSCFLLPNINSTSGRRGGFQIAWHVPIDDYTHHRFNVTFQKDVPLDQQDRDRFVSELGEGYRLVRNKSNRYLQDRESMKTDNYSGIGRTNSPQDACVQETMAGGAIPDRTREYLCPEDCGPVAVRQRLLRAIRDVQEGREPPHVLRDEAASRFDIYVGATELPSSENWRHFWER